MNFITIENTNPVKWTLCQLLQPGLPFIIKKMGLMH